MNKIHKIDNFARKYMTVLNSQLLEHGLVLDACKVATPFTFKGFLSRLLKGADI
jgi:hypothetical protein